MIRQPFFRLPAVLILVIVSIAALRTTPVRGRTTAAFTYSCAYFHVSITIPKGWTPDTDFASKNSICKSMYSYASTWYNAPNNTASFLLNNTRGASTTRAAILTEVNDGLLLNKPTAFQTIRGAAGTILTAAIRSATWISTTEADYFFGAVCQRHYCIAFISVADLNAPKSVVATLHITLQSLRFLPGAATFNPAAKRAGP